MSRITKWKLEKTKVKVVFRLQFHATHIPQTGWDKLYISFIPADSGKATSKTTKANVRNGTCKWADPIYETTRLLQDINTKQYDERLYKLVVTMGSSRSSVLGEANINLAHYSDAQKPSVVALPLQGCDSGTILHVTVQLLTSKTGFREFEQQRELRERGLQSTSDESAARKISSSEDAIIDHMDKVNARIKFKEELPPLEEVGLNEEYAGSAAGFDGSSNTSESLYAEKHDTSSSHEVESLKSTISGDLAVLSLGQSSLQEKGDPSDHRFLPQGTNDWAHSWASDYSADNDLKNSYEENSRLRGSLEAAQSSIVDLKLEVSSLQSHAEEIGIEAQKFSHLLADEIASGEQLAKEVSVLKKECLKFKDDLEQLKISKISTSFAIRETMKTDQDHFFQEIQLRWLKGLLDMEDKIRALNSKACFGFHEMDFRSFNTDLEALLCTLQDLKQGTGQQISGLNLESVTETREMTLHKGDQLLAGTRFDADFYLAEGTLHCANIPALVSQEFDSTDANNAMKGKILELIRELNELKAERDGLSRKMDQMECYYEALVQELEENQRQMMGELQNLRNEHSTCLYTISATKDEMETITQDMNKQIIKFSEEKRDLDSLNKDLERRAATAEAALKRARLNYSIAVDQLQKDLEVLSFQVLSMYETNENLIKKAFTESSVPSFLGYEKRVQTQKLDSKEHHAARILQCQNQHDGSKKQNLDGDIVSEELNRSLLLQKGLYKKVEEEVYEVHLVNVYLDVFSKTLQETLLEISTEFNLMKEKVNNLTQQLGLSAESKELLILKLQAATDEVYNLKDYKDTCDAKCKNLALHNQVLEKQIQNVTHENCLLSQKTTEMEVLIKELASYESKYATCSEEKLELENLLKKEMLENGNLQSEVSSLQEEMKALRTEFDELASLKENLQNAVNVLPHKLQNMLASYDKKCNGLPFWSEHICQGIESKDIVDITLQIEEIQRSACEKIVQLIQEKKDLVHERDLAQVSLNVAQSDNLVMKEKFKHDIVNIMGKMNVSSALVRKLQSEVEAVANRLKISFEAEENYAQQHRELFSDFDHLKVELDQLAFRNNDLAQEIIALESVSEEVGRCKLEVAALSQEKEALMTTLKDKTEESANLSFELCSLKSSLQSFYDDLHVERSIRDMAQLSLNAVQSDKLVMKQKFEHDLRNIVGKMDVSNVLVQKLQAEVEAINNRLKISFEAEENYAQKHRELLSDFERLEVELQQLSENKDLAQEIMALENVTEELERCKLEKAMFSEEKEALMMTLKDKTEESAKLTLELNGLKSSFQSLHDEFKVDRSIRDTLESIVADLTSKLNEKQYELLQFDRLKTELVHLKQFVSDLELEKSRLCCILLDNEERLKIARKECSSNYCLEMQLNSMFEFLIASDVKVAFTKTQYEVWNQELMQQLYSKDCYLAEFQKKYVNVESMLNSCLASEANHIEESTKLMTSLNSIKSELDASIAQNRVLLDANSTLRTELEECKQRAESRDTMFHVDTSKNAFEVEKLEHRLVKSEEEIDNLMFSKEELEVKNLVLKAKLDEQQPQIAMLEEYKNELTTLQNKYNELAHRLSEQVLKTEEFKNLSIHLKELKDKADAECIQVCEKREPEGPPLAMQESLRIAFIKEQYETRLQELKHQLSVSKKHSEEMLWKLQDAIDEVENKKKSEASYLKRNGELGMRILELETELQSAISEKREMMKVYDLMKAEKECSSISLECCKEEKLQLEASLQKCNEEKSKISIELTSMKDLLESSANVLNSLKEENDVLHRADSMSNEPANKMFYQKNLISVSPSNGKLRTKMLPANGSMNDPLDKLSDQDISQEVKQACLVPINEADHSNAVVNIGAEQDALMSRDVNGVSSLVHVSQDDVLQSETKRLALVNKHFKAQSLKSSMDHLHRELERMKYENLILTQDDNQFDPDCPALQKELMKLHKVNEELGSIFPLFNEFSSSGNALERVLALEIELAESLQAKKNSSIHFQSSFLKQHSDEEAVFQSFRDINELIEDMLELKGRYAAVETELKDMHDRYSQLSLQFAEVEGERQKLMMTLKNVRASKKAPQMSRSSTVPFGDNLS